MNRPSFQFVPPSLNLNQSNRVNTQIPGYMGSNRFNHGSFSEPASATTNRKSPFMRNYQQIPVTPTIPDDRSVGQSQHDYHPTKLEGSDNFAQPNVTFQGSNSLMNVF